MNRPRREQFRTFDAWLRALNAHIEAQHSAHVIEWYWHHRLNGVRVPIIQHLM